MSAIIWLRVLAGIFICSLVYIIWSNVLWTYIGPMMIPSIESMNDTSAFNKTYAMQTITVIETVWMYWPLVLIFGLIMYGVAASVRREPDELAGW